MAVLYTYSKEQDKHYITNDEGTNLTYVLSRLSDCVNLTQVSSGTITPAEKKEIVLSLDGVHEIVLTNQAVETATVDIDHYLTLETSLIQDVFEILCGCDCGCTPCTDTDLSDYKYILMALTKMISYVRLKDPLYATYLGVIYGETNCLIKPDIYCNLSSETITGETLYNEQLLKRLIALDYLAVYFYELDQVSTDEDIAFVKAKYQTEKILCCITKLQIDITALKVKIDAI